jgi:hypothetical protein
MTKIQMTETEGLFSQIWIIIGFRTLEHLDLGFVSDFVFRISSLPADIDSGIEY